MKTFLLSNLFTHAVKIGIFFSMLWILFSPHTVLVFLISLLVTSLVIGVPEGIISWKRKQEKEQEELLEKLLRGE